MSTYSLIRNLLDQIQECMDDSDCKYKTFVSLGEPPADCDSIAAWLEESSRNDVSPECKTTLLDTTIKVMITQCCVAADAELEFDPAKEQKDAECFLNDLDLLRQCINCSLESNDGLSCNLTLSRISTDVEKMGGCYSATLELEMTEQECCPEG